MQKDITLVKPDKTNFGASISTPQIINVQISQTTQGNAINTMEMNNSFNKVRLLIDSNKKMSNYDKKETLKKINELENEVKKEKPNKDIINRLWNWIKRNTPQFVVTTLAEIIAQVISKAI